MVLGGGPNRIGQGIEFDYCCVHAALAMREDGYETIMVNCNPETVSTDYDTSDRLYFEPVTLEDVRRADGQNYLADRATLRLERGGILQPERRYYPAADQNTREVAIRTRLSGDFYAAIGEPRLQPDGRVGYEIRLAFHPMIWALGLGAFMIVLGGGCALYARAAGRVVQRRRVAGETAARGANS